VQLESLQLAADYAAGFVNSRGTVPVARLHDVLNNVSEIALHGVRHGAAIALAMVQVHSGYELQLLPHGFLATDRPEDHESLVKDFSNVTNTISFSSSAGDIVNKVFLGP
jgi:hypothetical protein